MHYHVKVGLPANIFAFRSNWDELRESIDAEVDLVMRKYDEGATEADMEEYGIEPAYHEDEEDRFVYNPEGVWDWYEMGGRWRKDMIPDEATSYEKYLIDKFQGMYQTLHTSQLHDGCEIPFHVITYEEPHDMMSIERYDVLEDEVERYKGNFKAWLRNHNKEGKYDDYIWTTVDIHN